jgi:hypothetical protein
MEIVLNRRVAPGHPKRFEFVEKEPEPAFEIEPGLKEFIQDASLSGGATEAEIEVLKSLRLKGRHPTPLFYYRELQNLRDPLHFRGPASEGPCAPVSAVLPERPGCAKAPRPSRAPEMFLSIPAQNRRSK